MSNGNLEIKAISGHNGKSAGSGVSRDYDVCKLIDTTTCIGCKACEVACVEWNGYEFRETTFDNTYQTMPETAWNFWNLIKFNEVETDGGLQWLMRKDVHALRRARLPHRLPRRWRHCAVHQRHRRL
jgi:ferredoxin